MNILAINGSPKGKRSNTWRLTSAFLDGIIAWAENGRKQAPAIETLSVSTLDIKPCLGCFSCWRKTPGKCCIHDDMRAVIEKILWADVIIWSFPLYYFGLPGQLKNLIDRQLPMSLPFMSAETESGGHPSRYDMSGKRTVVVSTCGFYTAKGNYGCVTSLFDRLCGKGGYTAIFCGQGELFRVKELADRTDEYLSWVRKAGEEFASGEISTETRGKLDRSLFPRDVFEAMADASWGVGESGEKEDPSLVFTRQMAALYRKQAWPGRDIVLDMNYTDIGNTYRIVLGESGSRLETEPAEGFSSDFTTRINTPLSVWRSIASGEIAGDEALMQHLYSVEGDFDLMMHWDDYFGAVSGADVGETDAGESGAVADGGPAAGSKANKPKTNMLLLLTPWIVFWIAAAIDGFWGSLVSIGGMRFAACSDAADEGDRVRPGLGVAGFSVLHRVAGGSVPCSGDSGVLSSVWADVDGFLLPQSAADRALLEEQLQRGSGIAQSNLHKDEPHLDRGVGRAVPDHSYLDVLHHANGCSQLRRRDQLHPPRVDGRIHRLVPKVVSPAYSARIAEVWGR